MAFMKAVFRLIKKADLSHMIPMLLYLLGYLIWFRLIEEIPRDFYIQVITEVDRWIPFVEVFIIPYLSWFFYVAVGIILIYYRDRDAYDKMCTMLMIGMTLFLLVSTFVPTRQPLRLTEMPHENVFTELIISLWETDTPTNVWPSIHVFNTTVIEIAYLKAEYTFFKQNHVFRIGTLIWSILIILSTLFVRQHTLFDVLSALAIASICYGIVYISKHVIRFGRWDGWIKEKMDRILNA